MPPRKNKLSKTTGSGKENLHRLQSRDMMKTTEAYVHNVMRKSHNLIQTKQAQIKGTAPTHLIPEGVKDHFTSASLDDAITNLRESIQMVSQNQMEKSFLDVGMYSSNVMKNILGVEDKRSSWDVGTDELLPLSISATDHDQPMDLRAPLPSPSRSEAPIIGDLDLDIDLDLLL